MAEEPDVIREHIQETRSALTEKLETLEGQVRETVQSAKETVEGTIENVRSSVQETVASVKRTFDLSHQVDHHPWAMLGGSFLTGFVLGNYLEGRRGHGHFGGARTSANRGADLAHAPMSSPNPIDSHPDGAWSSTASAPAAAAGSSSPGWFSRLLHTFDDEIEKAKGLAIGAAVGVLRDLAKQSFPKLAPHIDEVMDSAAAKLGGQPLEGPLVEPAGTAGSCSTASARDRPGAWQG